MEPVFTLARFYMARLMAFDSAELTKAGPAKQAEPALEIMSKPDQKDIFHTLCIKIRSGNMHSM